MNVCNSGKLFSLHLFFPKCCSTLEHCAVNTVGVAGLGFWSIAGMLMENIWARVSAAQQELAWAASPPCTPLWTPFLWHPELITPRARTLGTMFPPESWRRTCRSRASLLWKPALSSTGLPSLTANKSHLKVTGELVWTALGTSAMRSPLNVEWHEVYATINNPECGRAAFQMCVSFDGMWESSETNQWKGLRKFWIRSNLRREKDRLYGIYIKGKSWQKKKMNVFGK